MKSDIQVKHNGIKISDNIAKISSGIKNSGRDVSSVPMTKKEFEILICLAESCTFVSDIEKASLIFDKLKLYFIEVYKQSFTDVVVSTINPNPWDLLTRKLTVCLTSLAIKFPKLSPSVVSLFHDYLNNFQSTDSFEIVQFFSFYGFLSGLVENAKFFSSCDIDGSVLLKITSTIQANEYSLLKNVEKLSMGSDLSFFFNYQAHGVEFCSLTVCYITQKLIVQFYNVLCSNETGSQLSEFLLQKLAKEFDEKTEQEILESVESSDENDNSVDNDYVKISRKLVNKFKISEHQILLIAQLRAFSVEMINLFDSGADFISLSSVQRIDLCYAAKSVAFQTLSLSIYQEYLASDDEQLIKTVNLAFSFADSLNNYHLATSLISLSSLILFKDSDSSLGPFLNKFYSFLISTPYLLPEIAHDTAHSIGLALKVLPQDAVVSTIYSIINMISTTSKGVPVIPRPPRSAQTFDSSINMSTTSISSNVDSTPQSEVNSICEHIFENAVTVAVEIVKTYNNSDITTLVVTMFSQKIEQSSYLISLLTDGLARCSPYCQEREFIGFTRLLSDLIDRSKTSKNSQIVSAVTDARVKVSKLLLKTPNENLYNIYLKQLLRGIVDRGDIQKDDHHRSHREITEVAGEISQFLKPLALLLPEVTEPKKEFTDSQTIDLFKNSWFNLVIHGYTLTSEIGTKFEPELRTIAHSSPPLASEISWNRTETSLELNSVLRRGSSNHDIKQQKDLVDKLVDTSSIELRTLSTSKVLFLAAAAYLETLRVRCGDFSTILLYFSDPTVKISGVEKFIGSLAVNLTQTFVSLILKGNKSVYKIENIAEQLKNVLIFCCHRDYDLQDAAFQCCDILIKRIPSSLCNQLSLFTLLDLLTLLYQSILDADTNVYDPKYSYELSLCGDTVTLSDSLKWRKRSLQKLRQCAQEWVILALNKSNMDMKALLQAYITKASRAKSIRGPIQLGVSFALEMGSLILDSDKDLSNVPEHGKLKEINTMSGFLTNWSTSYSDDLVKRVQSHFNDSVFLSDKIYERLRNIQRQIDNHEHISEESLATMMEECTGLAFLSTSNRGLLIRYVVQLPFAAFTSFAFKLGIRFWMLLMKERPECSTLLLLNVAIAWERSTRQRKGLFSTKHDLKNPESSLMEYTPTDKMEVVHDASVAARTLLPHLQVIYFLQSHLEATMYQSDHILKIFTRVVVMALERIHLASYHPFARLARFELIMLAITVNKMNNYSFTGLILDASLDFFKSRANFPHGSNKVKIKSDYLLLMKVANKLRSLGLSKQLERKRAILLAFLDDEINNIGCFLNPLNPAETKGKFLLSEVNTTMITEAYKLHPKLGINLARRYHSSSGESAITSLLTASPLKAYDSPDVISSMNFKGGSVPYQLLFYKSLCVVDAINMLISYPSDPIVTQLSVRSLSENINISFFYVPQIVQGLRYDKGGYFERFILETAKVSQLFTHQIIWNMNANKYFGDEGDIEDAMKPTLDAVQKKITGSLSDENLAFYDREFSFFEEVTGISGKLKPYIKKTKAEKKMKIDEEMAKIEVLDDVYLPSNPDGTVVDINRKSGKPLQSHAKAPFMATFKIKKEVKTYDNDEDEESSHGLEEKREPQYEEKWLSAIFKVGDDCRQDVLALQLISMFRTIWMNAGLDLFVFPYRVTATAPGCGVIDVLPNSISRDMLGREAVNGLYQYFITRFGPESSIEFQNARNNFVKSLAAYSVISYIFQFKDRHNGNIMYDDQGHILHIDFGFIFDIVPGGVKFEQSPFKLTKEMVDVMGGSTETQAYIWFEELCVKAFLAVRPHMNIIIECISPMLDSGLPCFKPSTINNLRSRFAPNKTQREASQFMRKLIRRSYESLATKGYDEFQRLTNGIPY